MADVDPDMTIVAPSGASNPLQLLWLFARSVAVAGIVASAAYAALYVAQDMRRARDLPPPAPATNIDVPSGFEVLTPLADAGAFQHVVGFAAIVPKTLPAGTAAAARLDATQPDASGARTGELRFAAQRGASGAARGPSLLLTESKDTGAAINSTVAPVADATLGAAVRCHGVRIDAFVYAAPGADPAQATTTAQRFIDGLAAQCGQ
jgi:hypothetical protein